MSSTTAYTQACESGLYEPGRGTRGKYDHVRRQWEEVTTGAHLRPHCAGLVRRFLQTGEKIRVLDLGCGSGDGFELISDMLRGNGGSGDEAVRLTRPGEALVYHGVDLNEELVARGRARLGSAGAVTFSLGDISRGLPVGPDDRPYDIYVTSFGTLSHLHEDETVSLFKGILGHAGDGALVIGDWLGRYSYEWQELWDADISREQWMDYRISYIYTPEERTRTEIEVLPLRLVSRPEIERMIGRVRDTAGSGLETLDIFDRSLLTGRHMDTAEYNRHAPPLRSLINSLLEPSSRTDVKGLRVAYRSRSGFDEQNVLLERLQERWNRLVDAAAEIIESAPGGAMRIVSDFMAAAGIVEREDDGVLRLLLGGAARNGERPEETASRREAVERLAGRALRRIEDSGQRGTGCGHGIVGLFEVGKR